MDGECFVSGCKDLKQTWHKDMAKGWQDTHAFATLLPTFPVCLKYFITKKSLLFCTFLGCRWM